MQNMLKSAASMCVFNWRFLKNRYNSIICAILCIYILNYGKNILKIKIIIFVKWVNVYLKKVFIFMKLM
jgi:hypothetical protein